MSSPPITYTARHDTTPEGELSTLANVYAFILDSAKKKGRIADKSGPDDAEKESKNDRAASIVPELP